MVNDDKTISNSSAPGLVWGFDKGKLQLVNQGSSLALKFDKLKPSKENVRPHKMTLKSHPGYGIIFKNKSNQHGHG